MPEPTVIMCIECLRVCADERQLTIVKPRYGQVGSNGFNPNSYKPSRAEYVIDGTHYCALHALPVYEARPDYVIDEMV